MKALLVATLLLAPSIAHAEIEGCNDDVVKKTIIVNTLEKTKYFIAMQFPVQDRTTRIVPVLIQWKAELVNIRQRTYDPANDVRYCSADMMYQNLPPSEWLIPLILSKQDYSCAKPVAYKIEKMLDKPGPYVTWQCLEEK